MFANGCLRIQVLPLPPPPPTYPTLPQPADPNRLSKNSHLCFKPLKNNSYRVTFPCKFLPSTPLIEQSIAVVCETAIQFRVCPSK